MNESPSRLRQFWLEDGKPLTDAEEAELVRPYREQEKRWQQLSGTETMAGMRSQRQALLAQLARTSDWDSIHDTLVGDHNLRWVMAKCFQHTLEHTTTLLQLAIFWDRSGFRGE